MQELYEVRSRVSALEDVQMEGNHAIRTFERFKETISDLWGARDSGMWKWAEGSDEAERWLV